MPTCPMYQLGNFVWYAVLQKCVRHVRVWGGGGVCEGYGLTGLQVSAKSAEYYYYCYYH